MKKFFVILLCMVLLVGITGCGNDEQTNKSNKNELIIQNIQDYYINYYNELREKYYAESYAAYKHTHIAGTKDDFKNNYYKEKIQVYAFKDINNDNIEDFIIKTIPENDWDEKKSWKIYASIEAYTIDIKTKEIEKIMDANFDDNLLYNSDKNIYLSKLSRKYEYPDLTSYYIISPNEEGVYNQTKLISYFPTKKDDFFYKVLGGGNSISEDEYLSYVKDTKEIVFEYIDPKNSLHELDDKLLKEVDEILDGNSKQDNLTCSSKDVDNIIELLLRGEKVRVDSNSDIKISSDERIQNYNQEYPYATEYTISCGSYSKSVRISHK